MKKVSRRRFFKIPRNFSKLARLRGKVNNDFRTLIEFIDRFGPEVSGRTLIQPHHEITPVLVRFAKGGCVHSEIVEICEMLRMHPVWIRWVADRIKMARPSKAET